MSPGHVAEASSGNGLALDVLALVLEHFHQIVDSAEAGGLGTGQGAAIGQALAGQNAVLEGASGRAGISIDRCTATYV